MEKKNVAECHGSILSANGLNLVFAGVSLGF